MRSIDNGFNYDNSCDSVDPVAIGKPRFSWWLDPYIAGHCYHLDTAQNHRRAQAFIEGSKGSTKNNQNGTI